MYILSQSLTPKHTRPVIFSRADKPNACHSNQSIKFSVILTVSTKMAILNQQPFLCQVKSDILLVMHVNPRKEA